MMETKLLKDLCTDVSYGYTDSASDKGNIKFLRITDIVEPIVEWDKVPYCTIPDGEREKYILKYGDIVVARTGNTTGYNYTYRSTTEAVFASYLIRFRINNDLANPLYVGYVLKTKMWWSFINAVISGSAQKGINAVQLGKFKVPLPPRIVQDKIVNELNTIDEVIEHNNNSLRTLQEYAQLLFRKWFVNFNFTESNMLPYKDNGGEMHEVQGLNIPVGWDIRNLTSLGEIVAGGTPPTEVEHYFTDSGIPWITPKDLSINKNMYISKGMMDLTEEGLKHSSAKVMPRGSVLMSSRAPIGYLCIAKNPISTNQGFKSVVPKPGISSEFIYYLLQSLMTKIERIASGSTFKEVSKEMMMKLQVIIPEESIIAKFNEIINPVSNKIRNLEEEIEFLMEARDLLIKKSINL